MNPDDSPFQIFFDVDIKIVVRLDQKNLSVFHVGLGENHVLLAFLGDVQPVPNHVDAAGSYRLFFLVPGNRFEFDFDFHAAGGFFGQVNVEADKIFFLVVKTYRRKFVVDTDYNFFDAV